MGLHDDSESRIEAMSVEEKLDNPGFLIWLLQQYAKEIETLKRKLRTQPAENNDGTKQLSRVMWLDRLRNHCAPFVLAQLQALKAVDRIDQSLLRKLAA